jgi:hypothetical protein
MEVRPSLGTPIPPPDPNDVTCTGGGGSSPTETSLLVTVRVGRTCSPPISIAKLEYQKASAPNPKLDTNTRRPARPQGKQRGDPAWPVLAGTRLLAGADFASGCPDRTTLVDVTGDVATVWRRYVAGLYENHGQDEATVDGYRITQTSEDPNPVVYKTDEYQQTLTLIEGDDLPHAVLAIDSSTPCD